MTRTNKLKRKALHAMAWDIGGNLSKQIVTFVITIFLARLLSPSDYGLIGMIMVFVAFSNMFLDFGFVTSLIQSDDVTDLTYDSVFYLNLVVGSFLSILCYYSAVPIANFYNSEELINIARAISPTFFISSLNVVQMAILKRELNFKVISIRQFISSTIGGCVGVIAAFKGLGVYSLVLVQLVNGFSGAFLLWSITTWKPQLRFSIAEIKKLYTFSSYVFLSRFTGVLFEKIDTLFIAKVFNPSILGFYSRATSINAQISNITSTSLQKVMLPLLSRLQKQPERSHLIFSRIFHLVVFVSFGFNGILFIMAPHLIVGLFGTKWISSIEILQILAFRIFAYPLNSAILTVLLSVGRSKEMFWVGLVRGSFRVLPIIMGWKFGFNAFLYSFAALAYLSTFYNLVFLKKYLEYEIATLYLLVIKALIPSLVLFYLFFNNSNSLGLDILYSLCFLLVYAFYSKIVGNHGFDIIYKEIKYRIPLFNFL